VMLAETAAGQTCLSPVDSSVNAPHRRCWDASCRSVAVRRAAQPVGGGGLPGVSDRFQSLAPEPQR
jgi:hypothetical protein